MRFDPAAHRFNSPLGKRILAATREGNYAHPGEEEAILLTLQPFAHRAGSRWLDAGCGRGGTAAFVQRQGWAAEVSAFDIDAVSIEEARQTYPEVAFTACGVTDAPEHVPGKFDLIYSFNAFYAFPDQPSALRAFRDLASPSAQLVIFDYVDRGGFAGSDLAQLAEASHWHPLDPKTFPRMLADAGWRQTSEQNLDADYARWYRWLVERFDTRRDSLLTFAPPAAIDLARSFYSALQKAVEDGIVGGSIVTAEVIAPA